MPALADAHAPHHRALEPAVVVRVAEVRVVVPRRPGGAEPQVLVEPVRRDHLARVHQVVRVEDRLELPEGPDQVVAEHLGQQLAARLAVAVLAGERAAVGHHQVRGALDEPPERRDALGGDQVERDPGVHAALAEVPVQGRARVAELVVELAQVAQVVTQPLRRHRGVLPALPGVGHVRHPGGSAEGHLADVGQFLLVLRVVVEPDRRLVLGAVQLIDQRPRPGVGLVLGVAGEDDHEPAVALRQQAQRLGVHPPFALERDQPVVEALQLLGLVRGDGRHGVGRAGDVRVPQHDQRLGRRLRHQAQLRVQDRDQRALAADQRPGHVEAVLGQQRVQVVAGHPPRDLRVALPDLAGAGLRQLPQGPVDLRPPAAGGDDRRVLLVAGRPGPEPLAVIGEDLEPERRCRRSCRRPGPSPRTSCSRSCRPACSDRAWPAAGRTSTRAAPVPS